jgi:hypothetical protein
MSITSEVGYLMFASINSMRVFVKFFLLMH